MRLTRRDALAVLAGAGVVGGGAGAALTRELREAGFEATVETMVAVAEVVYPSAVEGVPEFVETYSLGRVRERPAYREGVREATRTLDEYARTRAGATYADLDTDRRDALLREMGVDAADPDPDGVAPSRVRYYVVNELLYALYASPTGGRLVGLENPQGYPGGTASYQRGPRE